MAKNFESSSTTIRICGATQTYYGDKGGWWKYDWPSRTLTRGGNPGLPPIRLLGGVRDRISYHRKPAENRARRGAVLSPYREALVTPPVRWLIERGQSEGQAPTVWLDTDERPSWYGGWTTDPNEARRFGSAEAAEAYIERWPIEHARVTEHIWPSEQPDVRELTMQDRLLVTAHIEMLTMQDPTLRPIADSVIACVRCCDYFPECSHVVAESERVDREEGRV